LLNDGGTATYDAAATAALSDPTRLVFDYTVGAADRNVGTLAIVSGDPNGASIVDANGKLPDFSGIITAFPGLTIESKPTTTVTSVAASPGSGIEGLGQPIALTVAMSAPVTVAGGTPTLLLNDGGTATYVAAASAALSDPTRLVFDYTVGAADRNVGALAIVSGNSNGASITDANGNQPDFSGIVTTLSGLAVESKLTTAVTSVAASPGSGIEGVGQAITLTLAMSAAVTVAGGSPTLLLNDGGTATYDAAVTAALSDPTRLVFDYTVGASDHNVDALAIMGGNSNGASIADANGNQPDFSGMITAFAGLRIDVAPAATAIGGGSTLEIPTAASTDVVFGAGGGTLQLDQSVNYSGHVAGFGLGDSIDLRDVAFGATGMTLGYAGNSSGTAGTLTVSDGASPSPHTATLALLGQYMAGSFALSSDGHGGTLVTDPAVVQQTLLAQPQHA
jgi:hypothetical protein